MHQVGWRLAFPYWGLGYATEGARLALAYGFTEAGLEEIVSLTAAENTRSIAVMERLDMTKECEFEHPWLPDGHRLRRHVLYRLTSRHWQAGSRP